MQHMHTTYNIRANLGTGRVALLMADHSATAHVVQSYLPCGAHLIHDYLSRDHARHPVILRKLDAFFAPVNERVVTRLFRNKLHGQSKKYESSVRC